MCIVTALLLLPTTGRPYQPAISSTLSQSTKWKTNVGALIKVGEGYGTAPRQPSCSQSSRTEAAAAASRFSAGMRRQSTVALWHVRHRAHLLFHPNIDISRFIAHNLYTRNTTMSCILQQRVLVLPANISHLCLRSIRMSYTKNFTTATQLFTTKCCCKCAQHDRHDSGNMAVHNDRAC